MTTARSPHPRRGSLALAVAATLGLSALALTASPTADVHAQDTSSFKDKYKVTATRAGGKLQIHVEGQTVSGAQWYVNTDYPLRFTLTPGEGQTLGKNELTKDDASFEGTENKGKAKKAKLETTVTGSATPIKGSYKLVVCSADSCSPPIKGEFAEAAP